MTLNRILDTLLAHLSGSGTASTNFEK